MNRADVVKKYLEIRDYLDRESKKEKERLAPYFEGLETLENLALQMLNESGDQNMKTEFGTAYKTTSMGARVIDREALFDYVLNTEGAEALLTAAVAKDAVKEFIEKNKSPPPGVDITYVTKVNFRRS